MKISVITVCYNVEATIARTIESFLEQDYSDREMIVIDGASKDSTCDVVRRYDSPLIRLYSEPDKGIYDALNKGIAKAEGDVIGLLHANDFFAFSEVLSRIAEAFVEPERDAVFADVAFFAPGRPERVTRRYRSDRFNADRLRFGWMPAHPTLFLRRGVFDTYGVYRTDYRIGGDFEFVARIFKDKTLNYRGYNEIWTKMEMGGASTAGLKSKIILNKEVLRACRELGIKTNLLMLMSKYPFKVLETVFHGR